MRPWTAADALPARRAGTNDATRFLLDESGRLAVAAGLAAEPLRRAGPGLVAQGAPPGGGATAPRPRRRAAGARQAPPARADGPGHPGPAGGHQPDQPAGRCLMGGLLTAPLVVFDYFAN